MAGWVVRAEVPEGDGLRAAWRRASRPNPVDLRTCPTEVRMRAVLTRAGIVCILIAGCGSSGAELGTGTGGEIGDGMGGSSGNVNPNGSTGGTVAGAGGTPVAAGGTAGVGTTSSGGGAGGG